VLVERFGERRSKDFLELPTYDQARLDTVEHEIDSLADSADFVVWTDRTGVEQTATLVGRRLDAAAKRWFGMIG
jgi:hypothetical protein